MRSTLQNTTPVVSYQQENFKFTK